jgi:hypothetical protein
VQKDEGQGNDEQRTAAGQCRVASPPGATGSVPGIPTEPGKTTGLANVEDAARVRGC